MPSIIIIGNSGSGKTHLANNLGSILFIQVHHLDGLFWKAGGFSQKRSNRAVNSEIRLLRETSEWIVEGVFGELAEQFVEKADWLLWLNMDWEYCERNLLARGSESSKQVDSEQAEENFQNLLTWASNYWERDGFRSYSGHKSLFVDFSGSKMKIMSRQEVDDLIQDSAEIFSQ